MSFCGNVAEASSLRLHRPALMLASQHAIVRRAMSAVLKVLDVQHLLQSALVCRWLLLLFG